MGSMLRTAGLTGAGAGVTSVVGVAVAVGATTGAGGIGTGGVGTGGAA